jgi:hypothetical protein
MVRKRITAIGNSKAIDRIIKPGLGAVDLSVKRLHDVATRSQPQEDVSANPSGEYEFDRDSSKIARRSQVRRFPREVLRKKGDEDPGTGS